MTPVKTEMLRLYKSYEDVIEYFNYDFPKVLAKKMFDIGEDCYTFTFKELEDINKVATGWGFDIDGYYLITKSLGYNVKKFNNNNPLSPTTLTFYL